MAVPKQIILLEATAFLLSKLNKGHSAQLTLPGYLHVVLRKKRRTLAGMIFSQKDLHRLRYFPISYR
ncbi:hypothetical protein GCM10020370_16670 [Paenibacillus hodogayensis]